MEVGRRKNGPTGISFGMVASPQYPLPFRPGSTGISSLPSTLGVWPTLEPVRYTKGELMSRLQVYPGRDRSGSLRYAEVERLASVTPHPNRVGGGPRKVRCEPHRLWSSVRRSPVDPEPFAVPAVLQNPARIVLLLGPLKGERGSTEQPTLVAWSIPDQTEQ